MSARNTDLVETINKIGENFDRFQETAGKTIEEVKAENASLRDRIEELESRGSSPGKTVDLTSKDREHKQRFDAWLRKPKDRDAENRLAEFETNQLKAVSIGSDPGGGFAVPEEIVRNIERLEKKFSPVRSLVKVIRVGTSDVKHLVNIRGAGAGWVGEGGDGRTETNTPQLRERTPTMGELYAYPWTSEWALDDVFFDVGAWLAEEVAEEFAIEEGRAVLTGDGTNKLTGMLNTTPTTDADFASPLRAAAAYQFLASLSDDSPPVAEILPDALLTLVYAVNSRYRAMGSWAMNSNAAAAIRKLKDAEGRYLWAAGLAAGQPDMLLGYPVSIWEQMDDIGTNNFPVAFGNFARAYLLCDRTQIRITVNANITKPGTVKYFVRRREGGCVLNNDAIKFLRTTIA